MKHLFTVFSLFVLLGLKAQNPTWSDDVACIVYSHCTSCHNPNGSGPFSLLTYSDALSHASSIQYKVKSKEMPPWPVNNAYRKFAHDRSLTDQEISTIVKWVNNGSLEGNSANAPAPPVYNTSLQIPFPDLKLKIPTYTIPNITEDLYRCFVLPTGLNVQKFITRIEIVPGNRNIVHHAQVFYDTTGNSSILDAADPNPGYTSAGGIGVNSAVLLGTWVPGSSPIFVPNGMGKRLPSNAKIVVQIHYPEYASGQVDSSKFNFVFTSNNVRNISDAAVLNHNSNMVNGPLFIPKNTVKAFREEFIAPANVTIISVGPHAHLLCKSLKSYGITLAGDTIPIIDIPEWDFHWQGFYNFKKPIKIPVGTKLIGEGVYDNTTNNPHNPNTPPKDVSVGEATTDEMMLFYFSFLLYQNGDENIVVEDLDHGIHHLNCVSNDKSSIEIAQESEFLVYPNPSNKTINLSNLEAYTIQVYDAMGQTILNGNDVKTIDTEAWSKGIYFIHLKSGDKTSVKKILIQ